MNLVQSSPLFLVLFELSIENVAKFKLKAEQIECAMNLAALTRRRVKV